MELNANRTTSELFEEQARLFPDRPAVSAADETLTFAELNDRSNQVALALRNAGVGCETIVAVAVERCVELPAALLGVLKAGGAFLALDESLPAERTNFVLADSQAEFLLTTRKNRGEYPGFTGTIVTLEDAIALAVTGNLPRCHTGDQLMYIIYTSGSTGVPKGVEVLHRSVADFLQNQQRILPFTSDDVMLAHTSIAFDVSVFEIFLPLVSGGKVALVPRSIAVQGDLLAQTLESEQITVMLATPSTWQMLLMAGWKGNARLKSVCGGETLTPELAHRLAACTLRLWNHYGPTETTIAATAYIVRGDESRIPIGRPFPGVEVIVSNDRGEPVSGREPGELYLLGAGLARGYRNRPDLTASRFPDILLESANRKARAYRTGDVVRFLEDGNLEFIGRVDNQVKVRGFRIELEEIESALVRCEGIAEAAVTTVDGEADGARLCAYVVAKPGKSTGMSALRAFLRTALPAYMIPSEFTLVPELPRTSGGKIDRRKLQLQSLDHLTETDREQHETGPDVQTQLLAIWRKLLRTDSVTPADDFFELGGYSLLAVIMMQEIQRRLGILLPMSVLFEAPTIEELSARIESAGWKPSWSPLVAIRQEGYRPPLFCVHPIGGNVLSFRQLSEDLGRDQPFYGLQARGLDGSELPHTCVEAMAADYISLVRSIQPTGPYLLAGYSAGGVVAFEMARQLLEKGEDVALLSLLDSYIGSDVAANSPKRELRPNLLKKIFQLHARVRHFQKMASGEKFASIRRNFRYSRSILLSELRILRYSFLKRLGFENAKIRNVDSAFALAVREYKPAPLNCPMVLFRAAKSDGDHDPDYTMGWGRLAIDGIEVVRVPGDHFTLLYEPHSRALANELSRKIKTVLSVFLPAAS